MQMSFREQTFHLGARVISETDFFHPGNSPQRAE